MSVILLLNEFEQWLRREGRVSAATIYKYAGTAREFVGKFGVHATKQQFREYLDVEAAKSAPATYNRKLSALKRFHQFLVSRGVRGDDDPLVDAKMRRKPRRLPQPVSHEDMLKMLGAAEEAAEWQDVAILELAYGSGLRRDELAKLRLGNFVTRDLLRVIGKGDKERMTIITDPALRAVVRVLAQRWGFEGEAEMEEALFWRHARKNPDEVLFQSPTREATELADPGHFVWTRWQRYAKPLGIRSSPHKARHGFTRT
jgi:site-specific recombinase XerD